MTRFFTYSLVIRTLQQFQNTHSACRKPVSPKWEVGEFRVFLHTFLLQKNARSLSALSWPQTLNSRKMENCGSVVQKQEHHLHLRLVESYAFLSLSLSLSLSPKLKDNHVQPCFKRHSTQGIGYMEAQQAKLCYWPSKPHRGVSPLVFLGFSSRFLNF